MAFGKKKKKKGKKAAAAVTHPEDSDEEYLPPAKADKAARKKKITKIALISLGAVLGLGLIGGGGYFAYSAFMSGGDHAEADPYDAGDDAKAMGEDTHGDSLASDGHGGTDDQEMMADEQSPRPAGDQQWGDEEDPDADLGVDTTKRRPLWLKTDHRVVRVESPPKDESELLARKAAAEGGARGDGAPAEGHGSAPDMASNDHGAQPAHGAVDSHGQAAPPTGAHSPSNGPAPSPQAAAGHDAGIAPRHGPVQPHGAVAPLPDPGPLRPIDPQLLSQSNVGELPIISKTGQKPWMYYSNPTPVVYEGPKVAIVFAGMGLNKTVSEQVINEFPASITLAFSPYASDLTNWGTLARGDGHEVLIQVPMEPNDFPFNDPGPKTLLVESQDYENVGRLQWAMAQLTGFVGILPDQGARFFTDFESLLPVMTDLQNRGLIYVNTDTRDHGLPSGLLTEMGIPRVHADLVLREALTIGRTRAYLQRAHEDALKNGSAVVVVYAYPSVVRAVREWIPKMHEAGFMLVPISKLTVDTPPKTTNVTNITERDIARQAPAGPAGPTVRTIHSTDLDKKPEPEGGGGGHH